MSLRTGMPAQTCLMDDAAGAHTTLCTPSFANYRLVDALTGRLSELEASTARALYVTGDGMAPPTALLALPMQYVDYALWQRGEALAPLLASHREYWRSALREGEVAVLERTDQTQRVHRCARLPGGLLAECGEEEGRPEQLAQVERRAQ